jgi:hypothetical protein
MQGTRLVVQSATASGGQLLHTLFDPKSVGVLLRNVLAQLGTAGSQDGVGKKKRAFSQARRPLCYLRKGAILYLTAVLVSDCSLSFLCLCRVVVHTLRL